MDNKKQNPMIDQMLKLAEIADVLTKKQAKEFVALLMEFAVKQKNELAQSFTDNTDNLTREVYKKIQDALFNISQKHADALLEVRQLTNKQKKAHEDAMAKIELLVEELKAMEKQDGIDGVDGKDGIDGKDGSPDTREQIVEKINSGKDKDTKIEAKQIIGLPEFTREVVREVGTTFQTETPLKAGANITITKDAQGANVITGTSGGGSGDMLKATYDPFNVAADVFDLDNISQGATNKYVTATDLTHLSNLSGTNTGDQSFSNGSDATSHTLSLSGVGGSIKLVEGSNITLTTTGTAGDGIVTIASTASGGTVGPGTINELAYFDTTTSIASLATATYPSLTELSYVKGVTSAIQTQLGTKASLTSPTFATSITGSYLTASEMLITDGSKNIVSAAVATYPSLTELTYLKGVTSAIQTQITARLPLAGGTMTGNLLFTDNTYDIGASLATRPRNIYTSGITYLGKPTAGGNTQKVYIGHNGTSTVSGDGVAQLYFNSQYDNNPFSMGAEGNGYNFYIRQTNGGQGTFAFNFGTISTVAYQTEYQYVTDHYEQIFTGKWLTSFAGSGSGGAYYGFKNTVLANSTSAMYDSFRIERGQGNGYYPVSNDPIMSLFAGDSTATVTATNRYVARFNRLGFLGIGTTNTYAAPTTMQQAAITVDMGSKTGVKFQDGTTAMQVHTTGSSTTVNCIGDVNGIITMGLMVGSKITANSLTRTIVSITNATSFVVDSAVDWSNGGAGYNFTYTNPYLSFQDGTTKYFTVAADGTTKIGGGLLMPYVAKTANYTIVGTDYTIDCTSNTFTVTLLTAVGIIGQIFNIKNSGTGVITVATTSSQTIDGGTTLTLNQYDSIQLQSNGANWIII